MLYVEEKKNVGEAKVRREEGKEHMEGLREIIGRKVEGRREVEDRGTGICCRRTGKDKWRDRSMEGRKEGRNRGLMRSNKRKVEGSGQVGR